MEMEFLTPHFMAASEQLPPDYTRQFTFDPGKAKVLDRTTEITDFVSLQVRNQPKTR